MPVPRRLWRNNHQLIEIGIVSITAGLTGLALCSYAAMVTSSATTLAEPYSASIPWLQDQTTCEKTDRSWHNEQCWDSQHDTNF